MNGNAFQVFVRKITIEFNCRRFIVIAIVVTIIRAVALPLTHIYTFICYRLCAYLRANPIFCSFIFNFVAALLCKYKKNCCTTVFVR